MTFLLWITLDFICRYWIFYDWSWMMLWLKFHLWFFSFNSVRWYCLIWQISFWLLNVLLLLCWIYLFLLLFKVKIGWHIWIQNLCSNFSWNLYRLFFMFFCSYLEHLQIRLFFRHQISEIIYKLLDIQKNELHGYLKEGNLYLKHHVNQI